MSSRILVALCVVAFVVAAIRVNREVTDIAFGFGVGCAIALGVTWLGSRNPPE